MILNSIIECIFVISSLFFFFGYTQDAIKLDALELDRYYILLLCMTVSGILFFIFFFIRNKSKPRHIAFLLTMIFLGLYYYCEYQNPSKILTAYQNAYENCKTKFFLCQYLEQNL